MYVSNCLILSMGVPSTAHGPYLLRAPTTLWQLFLGSLILRERQGVAAGLILWRWWRWQLTKAEESIAVLTPLHPLPLWGRCGSTSKRTPPCTSKAKKLFYPYRHKPRRGFRLDWVTHDCGGEMTEEGEIRWKM